MRPAPLLSRLLCATALAAAAHAHAQGAPAAAPAAPAPAPKATPAPPAPRATPASPAAAEEIIPTPPWSSPQGAAAPQEAVQGRKHRLRWELSLGPALLPSDSYTKEGGAVLGVTYHFSDQLAWEAAHVHAYLTWRSGIRQQLEENFGVVPQRFTLLRYAVDSNVVWSPVYAKLNLVNRGLVYLQPIFLAGVGAGILSGGDPDPGSIDPGLDYHVALLADVGLGLRLFLSPRFSLRYDLRQYLSVDLTRGTTAWPLFMSLSASVTLGGAK